MDFFNLFRVYLNQSPLGFDVKKNYYKSLIIPKMATDLLMHEAIKAILSDFEIDLSFVEGDHMLPTKDYEPIAFDQANFKPIALKENRRKIAFIDGGSQKIFQIPNLSILYNRIYSNVYEGRKRILESTLSFDFFSVTAGQILDDKIKYRTKVYPLSNDHLMIFPNNSNEIEFEPRSEISENNEVILDIDRVIPIARRFGEWTMSRLASDCLEQGDIIIMDGTLKASFPYESPYMALLFNEASRKDIIYCGLAKTSGLITEKGFSLLSTLKNLSLRYNIKGAWNYHPIAKSRSPLHAAELFVVNLHSDSNRVFRLDIQNQVYSKLNEMEINDIMSQIAVNSSDVSFVGYPYGLIDADMNARVKYNEVDKYKINIRMAMDEDKWKYFQDGLFAFDSHEILNYLAK